MASEPTAASAPRLILASASPRRLDLLRRIGIVPDAVAAAEVDETPAPGEQPRAVALRLALTKARAQAVPGAAVLGADTVVSAAARMLPKPASADEARACLEILSGRRHRVITGVAVIGPDGKVRTRVVTTTVSLKRLSPEDITLYLETGQWRGKAGGYGIQGMAEAFVKGINGSWSNVVGLPLYETMGLLQAVGIRPAPAVLREP